MTVDFLTALMTSRVQPRSNATSFRGVWLASVSIGRAPRPQAGALEAWEALSRLKTTLARCRNLVSTQPAHSRGK